MENINKKRIEKAGAIILHNDYPARIALIFRARENDWSFPKGHIEIGETPIVACIREIKEETGLNVEVITELPNNEYLHKSGEKIIVSMYLMRSKGSDFVVEHPGDRIEWVDMKEVENKLGYDNLKEYYAKIFPIIKNNLRKNIITS
jgi:8-oxo-dGTP diphosphatase